MYQDFSDTPLTLSSVHIANHIPWNDHVKSINKNVYEVEEMSRLSSESLSGVYSKLRLINSVRFYENKQRFVGALCWAGNLMIQMKIRLGNELQTSTETTSMKRKRTIKTSQINHRN